MYFVVDLPSLMTGCALGVERRGQCFPSKAKRPGELRLEQVLGYHEYMQYPRPMSDGERSKARQSKKEEPTLPGLFSLYLAYNLPASPLLRFAQTSSRLRRVSRSRHQKPLCYMRHAVAAAWESDFTSHDTDRRRDREQRSWRDRVVELHLPSRKMQRV